MREVHFRCIIQPNKRFQQHIKYEACSYHKRATRITNMFMSFFRHAIKLVYYYINTNWTNKCVVKFIVNNTTYYFTSGAHEMQIKEYCPLRPYNVKVQLCTSIAI